MLKHRIVKRLNRNLGVNEYVPEFSSTKGKNGWWAMYPVCPESEYFESFSTYGECKEWLDRQIAREENQAEDVVVWND